MNKAELIAQVAEKAGLTQRQAGAAVSAFAGAVTDALKKGDRVRLVGFGTFELKRRSARVCRNPASGEKVAIGEDLIPSFRPGKPLKEAVSLAEKD